MKRRIFIYNTVVVLVVLVIMLAVSSWVIGWVSSYYNRRADSIADANSAQVQSLLNQWEAAGGGWQELSEKLRALDYSLYVARDGRTVYSSLDSFQSELFARRGLDTDWPEGSAISVWSEGTIMVGLQSGAYTVVSMARPDMPEMFGRQRPQTEGMMVALLIIGIFAIVIILALSLVSTRFQIRDILRPVDALTRAAQCIERGDFSQPVDYHGRDEFTAVCSAFDQMREHLLAEREKNVAYERARTDLVAGISHDLRTPLTSVKGYIKGLRDGVANTPAKREQYLDVAYRKACDMDVLLQRLFYFSKLETGNLPLLRTRTDLGDFVRAFVRDEAGELEVRGGRMVLRGVSAPHPVQIDTEQMYRVLTNLTDNAIRYAGAHPLVLTLTVWRERSWEKLRFADNGQGVPQADLPHLFEQFWRGDQSRGGQGGEGSGLGLYIAKYIVEAHGGQMTARNDGGLVFEIALPWEEGNSDAQYSDCGGRQ